MAELAAPLAGSRAAVTWLWLRTLHGGGLNHAKPHMLHSFLGTKLTEPVKFHSKFRNQISSLIS